MKNSKNILIGFLALLCLGLFISFPTVSQKKYVTQWEYCAVNSTSVPYTIESQFPITGLSNICYIETNGCRNEEVKVELSYAKFVQDYRLDNNETSQNLAYNRVRETAYGKAITKLGLEGWEIITQPDFGFDSYTLNNQNKFEVIKFDKSLSKNVYFKRIKQP
jgi:hypothetical protein